MTEGKADQKKEESEVRTFPVPFALEEIKKNSILNKNTFHKPSKETINEKAYKQSVKDERLNSSRMQLKPKDTDLKKLLLLYQNRQFDEAEKIAISLSERFPSHPFPWKVLGALLKQTGRVIESLIPTQKSIQLAPQDASAHFNLGNTLQALGRWEEAKQSYKKAIDFKPDYAEAHFNLGITLQALSLLKEAEQSYKKAIGLKPDFIEAHSNLGVTLQELGRWEEAKQSYKKAIDFKPDYAEAHFNLGVTLQELGKWEEAEQSYKNAIAFKHGYAEAYFNLGNTLKALGRLEEAEQSYKNAIDFKPDFVVAHSNLGVTLQELGRLEEAEQSYKNSIALKPSYAEAHSNLGVTLQELGRWEDAKQSYKNAIALRPNYTEAHFNLGNTLKALNKLEEAEQSYKKAIALKSGYAEAHSNLGVTLQGLGRLEEAEQSYKKAIALRPNFAEALSNLGITLQGLGRLEEAEQSYKKAIALKSGYAEAHSNLGVTLQGLGRLEEAEQSYKKAIALRPNFAEAQSNLGNTLQELGRFEEYVSSNQQAYANRTGIHPVGDESLSPAITSVFFEITNQCNFHCKFCPSDDQKRLLGYMDLDLVKQLYEETANKNLASVVYLHLMGEPTLHPKLIEILKFGSLKNVKTNLTTNISTLGSKNISKILDSLYGTITASHMTPTEETYHIRGAIGVTWEKYISNLRSLVREYMKRLAEGNTTKNDIDIRVMVTQNTASNVSIIETSKEAGVILKEWNIFVAEVEHELGMTPFARKDHNAADLVRGNNHSSTSYLLQQGIRLTFWKAFTFANTRVNDDVNLKPTKKSSYCSHPFTDVGVLWNGDVTLCCLDHDGQLKVGNVKESSIEAVIQSDKAQKLRASMLGEYPLPSICQTCQERPVKNEKTQNKI